MTDILSGRRPQRSRASTVPVRSEPRGSHAAEVVMALLAHHVPLALVLDLTDPHGPSSADIFASEGAPDEHWWERRKSVS